MRVIVRDAARGARWRAQGAEVAVASLDDAAALERALAGASGLYTLLPEDLAVPDFDAHGRRMAGAMAAAVRASRVPHVVLLSAAAALPDGNRPARELHHIEQALRAAAARLTIVRASAFLDNLAAALPAARGEGLFCNFFPSSEVAFPLVATRDVGRVAAACLTAPAAASEIVDVVGPPVSPRHLAAALGAAMGKELRVVDVPAPAHLDVPTRAGLPPAFAAAQAELYACLGAGRVTPRGDRMVHGETTVEALLPALVTATPEGVADAMAGAWNRHDMTAFGELFVDGADFVNIFGDWLDGREEIARDHAARHRGVFRDSRMTVLSTTVRPVRDDVALLRCRWRVDGIVAPDGSTRARAGILLNVLERRGGRWMIVATGNTATPLLPAA